MNQARENKLESLLVGLFTVDEFSRFLAATDETREVLLGLPSTTVSTAGFMHNAVAALERRKLIDSLWFARLESERPRRADEIAAVCSLWPDEPTTERPPAVAPRGKVKPWERLAAPPPFLRPEDRKSVGGLRLLEIRASVSSEGVPLPVLSFTLKNESPGWLTLTAVHVDAICERSFAVFSMARPVEPAAFWDVEVPEFGGKRILQPRPLELPSGQVTMIEVRLHVLRAGRDMVPPGLCGRYILRFEFITGEGASAASEAIPCGRGD